MSVVYASKIAFAGLAIKAEEIFRTAARMCGDATVPPMPVSETFRGLSTRCEPDQDLALLDLEGATHLPHGAIVKRLPH